MVSEAQMSDSLGYAGIDMSKIEGVQSVQLPNPFEELDTIYKQDKYFKQNFIYLVRAQHLLM